MPNKDKARDVHRLLRVLRPLASQYPHCANTIPLPDGWSGSWRKSHLTHDTAWCKSHPRRNSCPGIPDISGSFHAILGNSPLVFLISRIVDTNCSTVAWASCESCQGRAGVQAWQHHYVRFTGHHGVVAAAPDVFSHQFPSLCWGLVKPCQGWSSSFHPPALPSWPVRLRSCRLPQFCSPLFFTHPAETVA